MSQLAQEFDIRSLALGRQFAHAVDEPVAAEVIKAQWGLPADKWVRVFKPTLK